jgi:hypothetical protein
LSSLISPRGVNNIGDASIAAAEKGDELAPSHGLSLTPRTTSYHIVEKKRCCG